jgi:regulation of enolase protein 1 (concanavalin A-like superfamily)
MNNISTAKWINPPKECEISERSVKLTTDPDTDFWQRSYYGFRNDNAPALLVESKENFTFTKQKNSQDLGAWLRIQVIQIGRQAT